MVEPINFYSNVNSGYAWLSNFYDSPIRWRQREYATAEHLYQAMKATNIEDHILVQSAPSPAHAKKAGRSIEMRPDWDMVRLDVMRGVLMLKFARTKVLAKWLLDTGTAPLVETSPHDRYWGRTPTGGQNKLGQLLVARRSFIRTWK